MEERQRDINLAVNTGLGANVLLALLKTVVGITGRSSALLADGINSTSDVAYYVVVQVFMRMAGRPPDEKHPYGHRQMESISALVVGAFIMTTGVAVFWDAVNRIYEILSGQATFEGPATIAAYVGAFTILAKIGLTLLTRWVGRRTENLTIQALAYDHRNDILSASAATAGIVVGRMGIPWVDPLAGAIVALVIFRTGIQVLNESSADLMDAVPGRSLDQRIREVALGVPGVETVEQVRSHRFGPYLTVHLTVGIDGRLSVATGDAIATELEQRLYHSIQFLRRVDVHYHPVGAEQTVPPPENVPTESM